MTLPDVPTFYQKKGHNGYHCHCGVGDKPQYDATDRNNAQCIMFGAIAQNTDAFCQECLKAIKKIDLGNGWTKEI
jgi:hypothetical protein